MDSILKNSKKKLLRKIATIAEKSVSAPNKWGWPPDCIGVFYQNKRPKSLRRENEKD